MVVKEKQVIKAIHCLLMEGRRLSKEGMSGEHFFIYFDELEGLMGYVVAWQDDKSDLFENELSRVCNEVRAPHIFEGFKRS